jgi:hypothetical protein
MDLSLVPLLCRRLSGGHFLNSPRRAAQRGGDLAFAAVLLVRLAGTVWVVAAITAAVAVVLGAA